MCILEIWIVETKVFLEGVHEPEREGVGGAAQKSRAQEVREVAESFLRPEARHFARPKERSEPQRRSNILYLSIQTARACVYRSALSGRWRHDDLSCLRGALQEHSWWSSVSQRSQGQVGCDDARQHLARRQRTRWRVSSIDFVSSLSCCSVVC